MLITLSILLFVVFIFSLFLFRRIKKQQLSLIAAKQQLARLGLALEDEFIEDGKTHIPPAMRLVVKIHDPIALAKRESKPAQLIGDMMPNIITKKVYSQLKKEIAKSLKEKEVEAEIKIETY